MRRSRAPRLQRRTLASCLSGAQHSRTPPDLRCALGTHAHRALAALVRTQSTWHGVSLERSCMARCTLVVIQYAWRLNVYLVRGCHAGVHTLCRDDAAACCSSRRAHTPRSRRCCSAGWQLLRRPQRCCRPCKPPRLPRPAHKPSKSTRLRCRWRCNWLWCALRSAAHSLPASSPPPVLSAGLDLWVVRDVITWESERSAVLMQECVATSDVRLGVFASQAPHSSMPRTTPASARRMAGSLMSFLLDPERTPTPPRKSRHRAPGGPHPPPPPHAVAAASCASPAASSLESAPTEADVPGPLQRRVATTEHTACDCTSGGQAAARCGAPEDTHAPSKSILGPHPQVESPAEESDEGLHGPRLLECASSRPFIHMLSHFTWTFIWNIRLQLDVALVACYGGQAVQARSAQGVCVPRH